MAKKGGKPPAKKAPKANWSTWFRQNVSGTGGNTCKEGRVAMRYIVACERAGLTPIQVWEGAANEWREYYSERMTLVGPWPRRTSSTTSPASSRAEIKRLRARLEFDVTKAKLARLVLQKGKVTAEFVGEPK